MFIPTKLQATPSWAVRAHDLCRHFRGRYRESLKAQTHRFRPAPALSLQLPRQTMFSARPSDHVQVQIHWFRYTTGTAEFRAQYLLGEAGGLPQGHAACVSRSRPGKLH